MKFNLNFFDIGKQNGIDLIIITLFGVCEMWYRRNLFITAVFFALLVVLSGCADQEAEYEVNNEDYIILRLAESESAGYPSALADLEFARLVEEKSGGRIMVKVYDSSQLGNEKSVAEQVHFGGIDLARVGLESLTEYDADIEVATLPFIFKDVEHMWEVIEGQAGESFEQNLVKENIICLCWYEGGARHFYCSKGSIYDEEGLLDFKINLDYGQKTMEAFSFLGVSFVPAEQDEIYSLLEDGKLDGIEGNIINYFNNKYYEVAKYVTLDAHSYIPEVLIISRTTMIQLSKSDQEILEQAALEAAQFQRALWEETESSVMSALKGLNVSIYKLSETERESLATDTKPLYKVFDLPFYDQVLRDQ